MRASLPHPLSERRAARREPSRRRGAINRGAEPARGAAPLVAEARTEEAPGRGALPDPAARRVRAAGGPLDRASYTCQCGVVFAAEVTTTVACPHCGDTQAW